jgi:hypothetical protein
MLNDGKELLNAAFELAMAFVRRKRRERPSEKLSLYLYEIQCPVMFNIPFQLQIEKACLERRRIGNPFHQT